MGNSWEENIYAIKKESKEVSNLGRRAGWSNIRVAKAKGSKCQMLLKG